MQRRIRFFLILLISLAQPLSGMAGIEAPTEPCPMQAAGMSQMADMGHDCCDDMDKMGEHGKKACKTGQECKTSTLLQVSIVKSPAPLTGPVPADTYPGIFPDLSPDDLWRPPTA